MQGLNCVQMHGLSPSRCSGWLSVVRHPPAPSTFTPTKNHDRVVWVPPVSAVGLMETQYAAKSGNRSSLFFQDFHVFKRWVARLDRNSIGRSHTTVLAEVTAVFQHFLECASSYPTALNSTPCNYLRRSKSLYCYIAILSISRPSCRTNSFTAWERYMSLRLPPLKACHTVSVLPDPSKVAIFAQN